MSGELLRKKGSYLFGDRVENKVVRSGKVAGKVATPETASRRLKGTKQRVLPNVPRRIRAGALNCVAVRRGG
jgi:hypothetical protein